MNWAHLHLILNHIPVLGGVATLGLICLATWKKDDKSIINLSFQWMILIGVLCLPVYFTGEPAEGMIEHLPGFKESFVEDHEKLALFSLVTTELLAFIGIFGLLKFKNNSQMKALSRKNFWRATIFVALINAGLMLATSNFGGKIRHTEIRDDATTSSPSHEN